MSEFIVTWEVSYSEPEKVYFTDEYIEMSIKNPNEIDKKRLEEINKERNENAEVISRLLKKLET